MVGKRIAVLSLIALAAVTLALSSSSDTRAQSFKPAFTYSVAIPTHDTASDTSNTINIVAPDYNYEDSSMYTFSPIDGSSVTGPQIAIADVVGSLNALSTTGVLGGPCNFELTPEFIMENASTDTSDELNTDEMYWLLKDAGDWPVPYRDKCENDIDDDTDDAGEDHNANGGIGYVNDGCPALGAPETGAECDNDIDDDGDSYGISNNGVNDGCPQVGDTDELRTNPDFPDYLEAMPHFINEMLDPDGRHGPDPPLQPRARYAGYTNEVSNMNIVVQIIVLNPGQLTELPGIKAQLTQALGHPSLVVLNNPVSQEEAPGSISDFCTPLNTVTTLLATTLANQYDYTGGGTVARHNPPEDSGVLGSGTHMSRNYSQSERDADGDGIENDLDPCPYTVDADGPGGMIDWDPRVAGIQPGADDDGDHLPNSCDPNDGAPKTDEDEDGYDNGQDICPLVKNGCNTAICFPKFPYTWIPAWDNQGDDDNKEPINADVGPSPDSIGNACDDSNDDGMEDGTGPNPGAGDCNDGVDNGDGDGLIDGNDPECVPFMDAAGIGQCRDAVDRDGDTFVNDGCPTKGAAPEDDATECADAIDDDGDTRVNDGCPAVGDAEDPGVADEDLTALVWGANPGTGQFYHAMPWDAVTINSATDTDGDGYSDSLEGTLGSDPNNSAKTPESLVIDAAITVGAGSPPQSGGLPDPDAAQSCNDGVDNDGDTLIDDDDPLCMPTNPVDGDGDGVATANPCEVMNAGEDAGSQVGPVTVTKAGKATSIASDLCLIYENGAGFNSASVTVNPPSCPTPTAQVAGTNGEGKNAVWVNWGTACVPPGQGVGIQFKATVAPAGGVKVFWTLDGNPLPTDNCPDDSNPEQTNTDVALEAGGASVVGDADGDVCDDDDDNDNYNDVDEWYIGTDPLDNCPNIPPAAIGEHDAWPLDINADTYVTVGGDVLPYRGNIGKQVSGDPPSSWWLRRLDLNVDDYITVGGDVLPFRGKIGNHCT